VPFGRKQHNVKALLKENNEAQAKDVSTAFTYEYTATSKIEIVKLIMLQKSL
jgi:hypothetical protein